MMADPLKRICNELGVCREEALFYLEGFRWDLNAAMEACRSKTLPSPSPTVQSSPGNDKHPLEEQWRKKKIGEFLHVAVGTTVDEATHYLSINKWNLKRAVNSYMGKSNPQPLSNDGHTGISQSSLQRFSGNEGSKRRVQQFQNSSTDHRIRISAPPRIMRLTSPSQLKEEESIKKFCDVVGASPQAAHNYLKECNWDLQDAINYFYGSDIKDSPGIATDQVVKFVEGKDVDEDLSTTAESIQLLSNEATHLMASSQVKDSGNPTQTLVSVSKESAEVLQHSLDKEQLIDSFQDAAVGATREVAKVYLEYCKWDVNQAVGFFFDSEFPVEYITALNMSLTENRDLSLSSMGLPSQSQFEDSYISQNQGSLKEGSSSSWINAGPTEIQRPLEEAGEENVTVAIPGMASSQVDGKAVEEGSSRTVTFPDPLPNQDRTIVRTQTASDTVTITIVLADDGSGASLDLPFRSNQTVRDIRNAIQEQRPDNERDYYLQSTSGVEYRDLNITVYRISTGGSTTLLQMFRDP